MIVLNEIRGPGDAAVSILENISRKAPKTHIWVAEHPNYDTSEEEEVTAETEW